MASKWSSSLMKKRRALTAAFPVLALSISIVALQPHPAAEGFAQSPQLTNLRTNAGSQPLGIDDPNPRFTWRLESRERGVMQKALRVLVASEAELLRRGEADLWDTGDVISPDPFVVYQGPPLESRRRYFWTVRAQTESGVGSEWAEPVWFETALMNPEEWRADWIAGPERRLGRVDPEEGAADDERIREAGEFCRPVGWPSSGFFPNAYPNPVGECQEIRPAPMLRKTFELAGEAENARLYVSGLGYQDITLNGEPVSDAVLDPGFTRYSRTVLYTTHDVTGHLQTGANALAVQLGSGQFDSSTQTWDWGWELAEWRATPRLRLQLHITYEDGSEEVIASNGDWRVSVDGPIRYDSYYLGETYDARREIPGWKLADFDDSDWQQVRTVEPPAGQLRAQTHEPIRIVRVLDPGTRTEPAPGVIVYDTGQNLSGWARIRVSAPAGAPVEIFYSEKMGEDGLVSDDVGYSLVGGQLQTDYYIAKGEGEEVWTPRFTYKGFQYLQISAPGGEPLADDVSVEVEAIEQVRTYFRATSEFEASAGLLNRIHRNTRWAIEGNAHGILTDTPIYEKNPWTGDAQLIAGAAALLFDTERLYAKLHRDMLDAQTKQGEVPLLAPSNENYGYVGKPAFKPEDCCGSTPAWDAFWFIVPWEAHRRFGDRRALEKTYPSMKLYLDEWIPRWTPRDGDPDDLTLTSGLGDWDAPEGVPTINALASTAYYAHLSWITADVARTLGLDQDAARYEQLFEDIRRDFNARFLREDGVYRETEDAPFTQTAQVLPLAFGLAPEEIRQQLAAKLADDIRNEREGNPYVGILGARYLLPVLTEAGYADVAYAVATQTDYPSWGYWIDVLGWTALGEYWEETSRSRNHYFFGAIVQWMYEHLAGFRPLEPGYRTISFKPYAPAGLDRVAASYESVRGRVAAEWRRTAGGLEYDITVPPNAAARIHLPASDPDQITEKGDGEGSARFVGVEGDRVVYEAGSGSYRFRIGN